MSNGGLFAYRLAAEISPRIAAVGAVGCAAVDFELQAQLADSVIHFHGTDDTTSLIWRCGEQGLIATNSRASRNQSPSGPNTTVANFRRPKTRCPMRATGREFRRTLFTGGKQGSEVHLYTIVGGGHTWPGHQSNYAFSGSHHDADRRQRVDVAFLPAIPPNGRRVTPSETGIGQRIATGRLIRPITRGENSRQAVRWSSGHLSK